MISVRSRRAHAVGHWAGERAPRDRCVANPLVSRAPPETQKQSSCAAPRPVLLTYGDQESRVDGNFDAEVAVPGRQGWPRRSRNPQLMASNAEWTTDEIILALDFYFETGYATAEDPAVQELSALLNALPTEGHREPNFRNPASVEMRLANFIHVDPEEGEGLSGISARARELFELYNDRRAECHTLAQAIREGQEKGFLSPPDGDDDTEDQGAVEGRFLTRLHRQRERNRSKVREKLKKVRDQDGQLGCQICGLDETAAARTYGKLFGELFECHHIKPLETLTATATTRLADLAILCPTCHRAIHRTEPLAEIDAMRERYAARTT